MEETTSWDYWSKVLQNPISAFLEPTVKLLFNRYTGLHFLANLVIVWSLSKFFNDWTSAIATFSIAVLWEVYEYLTEKGWVNYGTVRNWQFDTAMDLIVSVICIGAVLL